MSQRRWNRIDFLHRLAAKKSLRIWKGKNTSYLIYRGDAFIFKADLQTEIEAFLVGYTSPLSLNDEQSG